MKFYVARVALLLPFLLTACFHSTNQAQNQPPLAPPIEEIPVVKAASAPPKTPPPPAAKPQTEAPPVSTAVEKPAPPPRAPKHKHSAAKPAVSAAAAPATPPANEEAANAVPEVSAVGQLSSAEPADLRAQTLGSISDTEHSLNGINRKLNDQEQKTSAQIREFLKQARTALNSGDVDGAHTLALKAKVLLGELVQ